MRRSKASFAVGTRVTPRPPAQIRMCGFPAYGSHLGYRRRYVAVCEPTPVSRLSGSESSACLISPHSPWSLPFAAPTPLRIAPLCSSASQLLWRGQTSRVRSSSATAPHLPDACQSGAPQLARRGISRFPSKELLHMPGSSTTPGRSDLAMVRPKRVAFRTRNSVGTRV